MNRFEDFFRSMNDEEWEKFSVHVLQQAGFIPYSQPAYGVDGGQDYFAERAGIKYLVSCKHYIKSGKHVGNDDEKNISDRLLQFNATGFIGFYSTGITTGLQNRLDGLCNNSQYNYVIFGPQEITHIMQSMDTKILQSFGLYPNKYYMNVSKQNYQPLKCVVCGKDILTDENIPNSMAGLAEVGKGRYAYVYGCKQCLRNVQLYLGAFLEIEQALHVDWLLDWERQVDKWIEEDNLLLRDDFFKMRYEFTHGVRQRQLPQTEGTWYGFKPDDFNI